MSPPLLPDVPESDLSADLATLLFQLSRGWTPSPFRPGPLVELTMNEDLILGDETEAVATGFEIGRGKLSLGTVGPAMSVTDIFTGLTAFGQVSGRFGSGQELTGRGTQSTARVLSSPPRTESVVQVEGWKASHPSVRYWVGRLGDAGFDVPVGNLYLWARSPNDTLSCSMGHLALTASYSYYVVARRPARNPSEASWWLVLDPGGDDVDPHRVVSDMVAMRFALAGSLDAHTFYGVDAEGQTAGGFGVDTRRTAGRVSNGLDPAVPTREPLAWAAPFVADLAPHVSPEETTAVSVALDRYDQSVRALDIDNQYLHVVGAIATLARSAMAELSVSPSLVHEEKAWDSWVEDKRVSLSELAREGAADALVRGVRAACRIGVGGAAAEVFGQYGIDGGAAVALELDQAFDVFQRGSLVPLEERGRAAAMRGFDRVEALRRAFAVLVAARIGYGGRISGFEPFEDPDLPDPVTRVGPPLHDPEDTARAQVTVNAVAESGHALLTDWPTYEAPQLPDDPRVAALSLYAGRLEARTGGEVAAALRPLPRPPRAGETGAGSVPMSFRLYLTRYPETQTALFSAEMAEAGGALVVRGWEGQDLVLPDIGAVEAFVGRLGLSEDVRYRVEQLLTLADEKALGRPYDGYSGRTGRGNLDGRGPQGA